MKKVFAIAMAATLAFALAGCAAASKPEESSSSMQVTDVSESSSSSSASTESVKWTDAKTAAEAAKGAGIDKFGVMKKIELNDTEYKDPSFAYAGGVAQAVYESPATELILRKSDGSHTAPLSDRDKTEFAQTWEKSYDGVDVTCYGEAHGAATVFTWTDGTQEYAVTWQGLGGDEMSMDSDEVAAIVKGVQAANAKDDASNSSSAAAQNTDDQDEPSPLDGMDVEALVQQNGLGEYVGATQQQRDDGSWYWDVTVQGADGNNYTCYIEQDGTVSYNGYDGVQQGDDEDDPSPLDGMDPEALVQQNGLGDFVGASPEQRDDGSWYWDVTVRGADGNEYTCYIEQDGSVSYNGYDGVQQGGA